MRHKEQILIIFETSVIRNPVFSYNEINLGAEFNSINEYIKNNNITHEVKLAIAKFSIDELLIGRSAEFEKDKKIIKKFNGLQDVSLIKENFDYTQYANGKIKIFLNKNNILLIPYPSKEKLYKITKRSLLKKAPFLQSNKHSDYGFKDVVIWESILNFNKIKKFKKVILMCGDYGFDKSCEEEFISAHNCFFIITRDYTRAIKEIEETMAVNKIVERKLNNNFQEIDRASEQLGEKFENLRKLLSSDYFIDGIKQFISENSDGSIKKESIDIIKLSEPIEDWVINDESVGSIVNCIISINKKEKTAFIYLDDTNGIEYYELFE